MMFTRAYTKVAKRPADKKIIIRYFSVLIISLLMAGLQNAKASVANVTDDIKYGNVMSDALVINTNLNEVGHSKVYRERQFNMALQAYHREDYALSFRMFSFLAATGHTKSEYYVGVHYDMGEGVKKNFILASQWYMKAAIKGNDRAQHNLAVAYAKGEGVKENIQTAISWWLKSARQGNTDSAYNLGILYAMGHKDLAPNHKKAMMWWHEAAVSGDAYAQFNLGTMYANGEHTSGNGTKNYCEALHWWQLSANNGVVEALQAIELVIHRNEYKDCVKENPLNLSKKK